MFMRTAFKMCLEAWRCVRLNGVELALGPADAVPSFKAETTAAGAIPLAPATITFLRSATLPMRRVDD